MSSKEVIDQLAARRKAATPNGLAVMSDIFVEHALNAEVWDVTGKRYIDFASGTSTMSVGHCHPKVTAALHAQVDKFTHTFFQQLPYESYVELAERLNELTPGSFAKKTVLFTTGAGAVENAIKIARTHTGRSGVIAFHGAFHGRTLMTSTLAGKVAPYKATLGAPVGEVYHIPFPSDDVSTDDSLAALANLFKYSVDPSRIAAIIIEPVQGEAGFRVANSDLMIELRKQCDQHGIVLIADEVQTGFGRTGKLFAMEYFEPVYADLIVMSKSIGAGIPLSAVCGKAEIMEAQPPGGLGGTYNGNPLGCAAALAVLDIIDDQHLCVRAMTLGLHIRVMLQSLRSRFPQLTEPQGIGSMIAIGFTSQGKPNPQLMRAVQKRARDLGLILISGGVDSNMLRFLYPLTITTEVFEEGIQLLTTAIEQCIE